MQRSENFGLEAQRSVAVLLFCVQSTGAVNKTKGYLKVTR